MEFLNLDYMFLFKESLPARIICFGNDYDKWECPEQESNLHGLAATGPWNQRVYQFRHLGGKLNYLNLKFEVWSYLNNKPQTSN